MLNIIKADLYRIFKGKGIYICILSVVILCCISIYLKSPGHIGLNSGSTSNSALEEYQGMETPEDVRKAASENEMYLDEGMMKVNGNLYYPLVFIGFVVICVDLSNHTTKNVISTNISRTTYYLAKLLLTWGLGIFLLVLSTYFGYFGNIIFNGAKNISSIYDITIIMLRQIPIFCGIMSIHVMIAALVQKTSRYNAIAIILIMVTQLFLIFLITIFKFDSNSIMQFEFETIIRNLAVAGDISMKTLITGIMTGLGLTVVSSAIGIYRFNRCDIK